MSANSIIVPENALSVSDFGSYIEGYRACRRGEKECDGILSSSWQKGYVDALRIVRKDGRLCKK